MEQLILQLFGIFAPIVADVIKDHRKEAGVDPTFEQMQARFFGNIDKYLGEGSAWRAAHPNA
jgi:hypothetical protein